MISLWGLQPDESMVGRELRDRHAGAVCSVYSELANDVSYEMLLRFVSPDACLSDIRPDFLRRITSTKLGGERRVLGLAEPVGSAVE